MPSEFIWPRDLDPHLQFRFTRASGKGGQHVNKVSTRVELNFRFEDAEVWDERELLLLRERYPGGVVRLNCGLHRSQAQNKKEVRARLYDKLEQLLRPEKERKATKPSRAAKRKRLESKRKHSEKKSTRRWKPDQ